MKLSASLATGIALVLLAGMINAPADNRNKSKDNSRAGQSQNPPPNRATAAPAPAPQREVAPRPPQAQPTRERQPERPQPVSRPASAAALNEAQSRPAKPQPAERAPEKPARTELPPLSKKPQTTSTDSVERPAIPPSGPVKKQNLNRTADRSTTPNTPTVATRPQTKTQDGNGVPAVKPSVRRGVVKVEKMADGEHIEQRTATGRVQTEEVRKTDGTRQTKLYAPNGKVKQEVVVNQDGTKQIASIQYDRNGSERAKETIKADAKGRPISKTVAMTQTTIIKNSISINNPKAVRSYDRSRYGFAYRPLHVAHSPVFASYYHAYRPFHYAWGWEGAGWYQHHSHYWVTYDVYPAPSYWVTDWVIASYVADRYATSVSLAQAQEEVRLAQEDAAKAKLAAERAGEQAEIAEAQATLREAEAKLATAEARAAKAEAAEAKANNLAASGNPNAAPIDEETKEVLRSQIEQTVAEQKETAEQPAEGSTAASSLAKALADPKHIYPVSGSVSVTLTNGDAAGNLTEGDLLRLEPGQTETLQDAGETTLVNMRVITSKGEEGEAKAGTVISLPLKSLQDFDSEFRAKLDLGLAEADHNQDQFIQGALAQDSGRGN